MRKGASAHCNPGIIHPLAKIKAEGARPPASVLDVSATMASPLEVDVIGDSFDIDDEAEVALAPAPARKTRTTVETSVLEDDRDRRSSRGAANYSLSSVETNSDLTTPPPDDPLEIELELGLSATADANGSSITRPASDVAPGAAVGAGLDSSRASSTGSIASYLFSAPPSAPTTPARPARSAAPTASSSRTSTPIADRAGRTGGRNSRTATPSVLGDLAGGLTAVAAELPLLSSTPATTPQPAIRPMPPVRPPPSPATNPAGSKAPGDQVPDYAALKARLAASEQKLAVSENKLAAVQARLDNWEAAARDALNAVALSPASNERYKHEITEQLQQIMSKIEQVQKVLYINCSFPAISAQAPVIEMHSWTALDRSAWSIRWNPSWSVEVSLEGWHYIPFSLSIRVSGIAIDGRFNLKMSPRLDYFWVSFGKDIKLDMNVEVEVTWGIVNMPLQATIERMVRTGLDDWLRTSLIEPNSMRFIGMPLKGVSGVTDEDVQKATEAAEQAMLRTPRASDGAPQ